jgi:DNA-binding NarL/FixJ family response regulator
MPKPHKILVIDDQTLVRQGRLHQPAITDRILQAFLSPTLNHDMHPTTDKPEQQTAAFNLHDSLSSKELEVLRLMAAGFSNREIADAVFKSEGTVKNQVSAILSKLGVRDRTKAVLKAIDLGLLQ